MRIDMEIAFENAMGMSVGMGVPLTFGNRYDCLYNYTHPMSIPNDP